MNVFLTAVAFALSAQAVLADGLWNGFVRPPASARPQVWWRWMNGNVSKVGIIANLEAMAKVGIDSVYKTGGGDLALPLSVVCQGGDFIK